MTETRAGVSGGRRSHGTSARAAIFAQGKETGLKGSSFQLSAKIGTNFSPLNTLKLCVWIKRQQGERGEIKAPRSAARSDLKSFVTHPQWRAKYCFGCVVDQAAGSHPSPPGFYSPLQQWTSTVSTCRNPKAIRLLIREACLMRAFHLLG